MRSPRCCEKNMELKSVGTRLSTWDLFFQCDKCGEVIVKRRYDHFNHKFNYDLQEEGE